MAKILVTGGAGYIGSHTVYHLLKHGHDVLVVDNLHRGYRRNVPDGLLRQMSLQDTAALTALCERERFDVVVHFAAYMSVGESTREPEMYFENNVGGSLSLFTAMKAGGIKNIVFSSTAAVYGNPQSTPIPEDAPIDPLNPYGESKVMVERALRSMDEFAGVRSIALRYFNACGAEPGSGLGEEHEPETHLIPLLFRATDQGNPITIFGNDYDTPDGTCLRDYVHVSDLAAAHILALEHLLREGASDTMNVGTGKGASVLEVMRAVEEVTGKKVPYSMGERRDGDSAALVANSDRLQQKLGWKPKYTELKDIVESAWEFEQKRER